MRSAWHVYILRCSDNSLYTGITTDVERRLKEHNSGKASSCTRSRLPAEVVYAEGQPDRSSALKREAYIKSLNKNEKEDILNSGKGEKNSVHK